MNVIAFRNRAARSATLIILPLGFLGCQYVKRISPYIPFLGRVEIELEPGDPSEEFAKDFASGPPREQLDEAVDQAIRWLKVELPKLDLVSGAETRMLFTITAHKGTMRNIHIPDDEILARNRRIFDELNDSDLTNDFIFRNSTDTALEEAIKNIASDPSPDDPLHADGSGGGGFALDDILVLQVAFSGVHAIAINGKDRLVTYTVAPVIMPARSQERIQVAVFEEKVRWVWGHKTGEWRPES